MVKARKARPPRIGRPLVADADRRETLVRVLTTKAEHGELQQAAASVSMSVSTWVRSVALERARTRRAEKTKQDHGK
jgi:flavin reductase (DIM6/NTAB) family NADH-FMN oxidoreductase RutF